MGGLEATLAIKDEQNRAWALVAFLSVKPEPATLRSVRHVVAAHLKSLSDANREEVLQFCAEKRLFAPPFLDPDTLATIAGHIIEVCEEWRWM